MEGVQSLSLDAPLHSVMVGGRSIIITLRDILEVEKLKSDLARAKQQESEMEMELAAKSDQLKLDWTKILEIKFILIDYMKKIRAQKEASKGLREDLERMIFMKKMSNEFMEIIENLAGALKDQLVKSMAGKHVGKKTLEIMKGVPTVLNSLKENVEAGNFCEVINVMGKMKGMIKSLDEELYEKPAATTSYWNGRYLNMY